MASMTTRKNGSRFITFRCVAGQPRHITPDEIERVIDACPNAEWRLLFGLARYAGLRIPSESQS